MCAGEVIEKIREKERVAVNFGGSFYPLKCQAVELERTQEESEQVSYND